MMRILKVDKCSGALGRRLYTYSLSDGFAEPVLHDWIVVGGLWHTCASPNAETVIIPYWQKLVDTAEAIFAVTANPPDIHSGLISAEV